MPLPSSVGMGITTITERKINLVKPVRLSPTNCELSRKSVISGNTARQRRFRRWWRQSIDKSKHGSAQVRDLSHLVTFKCCVFSCLTVVMFKMTGMLLEYTISWAVESCLVQLGDILSGSTPGSARAFNYWYILHMGLARISLTESLGNFQETQNETLRTTWMPYKNSRCSNVLWEHVQIGPCSLSLSFCTSNRWNPWKCRPLGMNCLSLLLSTSLLWQVQ